jgi:hypothetical protein
MAADAHSETQPVPDAQRHATPLDGLLLAYASVAPIAAGGAAALAVPAQWRGAAIHGVLLWSAAVLCFLAGVRRGDSFHTPRGPTMLQLAGVFGTFGCAILGLALPWPRLAIAAVMAGFAAVGVLDPVAARRSQAARFFARIRPPQTGLALAGLAALLAATWR